MSTHELPLPVRLFAATVVALITPVAGDDFSDICHCMQSPQELIDVLDRLHVRHGMQDGPTPEMFPDLSGEEFRLLKEYWEQCDVLRRYYANLHMEGTIHQTSSLKSQDNTPIERVRIGTFDYYSAETKQLRLDLRWEEEGSGKSKELVGVITPTSQSLLQLDEKTKQRFLVGHANNLPLALNEFCHRSPHDGAYTDYDSYPVYQALFFDMRFPTPGVKSGRIVHVVPRTDDDGEDVVQVLWKSNLSETHQIIVELLRRRAWAVKSLIEEGISSPQEAAPDGYAFRDIVRCTYSYGTDGMPLLKSRVEEKWFVDTPDLAQLKLESRKEIVVAQCLPGAAPPEVFDIDVILGKKRYVTPESFPTNWFWLLMNGFILLIIGVYLLRRSDKKSSPTPPALPKPK